jgi:hypothetical protein
MPVAFVSFECHFHPGEKCHPFLPTHFYLVRLPFDRPIKRQNHFRKISAVILPFYRPINQPIKRQKAELSILDAQNG